MQSGRSEDEVCGGCVMNGTRPGRHSPHLTNALALASYLDELRDAGASFPYPGATSNPYWWTCLVASKDGRRRADVAREGREKDRRKREQEEAERQRRQHGGGRR